MLGFMFLKTFQSFRSHDILNPSAKSCCLSRGIFPGMSLFFLLVISSYLTSKDFILRHLAVASSITSNSGAFEQSFLLATGTTISLFSIGKHKTELLTDLRYAKHVDFLYLPHLQRTAVFWADAHENKIYRTFFEETAVQEVVVSHGLSSSGGLAVDRVGQNLYWADQTSQRIEISNWNGDMRTTLLDQVEKPSCLVIDPFARLLFWISTTKFPNRLPIIEKSFLDGRLRQTLVQLNDDLNEDHVYNLAIFQARKEIYWLENLTGFLYCASYDGTSKRLISQSPKPVSSSTLAVTGNGFYWTDKSYLVTKSNQKPTEILTIARPEIYDFRILNLNEKEFATSHHPCAVDNGGCSHLCISNVNDSACLCPYGLQMTSGRKTCEAHGPILGIIQDDEPHQLFFVHMNDTSKWVYPPTNVMYSKNFSFALDSNLDRIYRIEKERIFQENLNDSSSSVVMSMGYYKPCFLALDWKRRNMYVMSELEQERGLLSVSVITGTGLTHLHWENIFKPRSLTVDVPNMYIFWSHANLGKHNRTVHVLEGSELDGSNRKLLYNSDVPIHSITPDTEGKRLCWLQHQKNVILCKDYGITSSVYSLPVAKGEGRITSFTFYQGNLLYGNDLGHLYSLNLSADNQTTLINKFSSGLSFISVIPPKSDMINLDKCKSQAQCSSNPYRKRKVNNMRAHQYLLYTKDGFPRTLSLSKYKDYPELLPGPMFQVSEGDKIAVLSRRTAIFLWVDMNGKTIHSIHRDGSSFSKILSLDKDIGGIEVDQISENIYWSIPTTGEIWVSRLDGQHSFIVHSGHDDHPNILALSSDYGFLFWSSASVECSISRSSLSGSEYKILLSNLPSVADLEVNGEWLYWSSPNQGIIGRTDLNGEQVEKVLESISYAPFSLAVERSIIYWTDGKYQGGAIMSKNGSEISLLKEGFSSHHLFLINEAFTLRLGTRNPCGISNGGCSQLCLYSSSHPGNVCHCAHGHVSSDSNDCQEYSKFVVFSNRNHIESIRVDHPTDPNPPLKSFTPLTDTAKVVALAYEPFQDRIYFNDLYIKPYLYSIHPNGSGLRPELKGAERTRHIEGLALDPITSLLLWTESTSPSVWSLNLGKIPNLVVALAAGDMPRGIVFHSCSSKLFWTNWNLKQPGIESCTLNQCSSTQHSLVATHSQHVNALNLNERRLFWSESSAHSKDYSIHSCNLDGTEQRVHAIGQNANPFSLLVLPNQQILWTDFQNKKVCLVEGPNSCKIVRTELQQPLGLALVDRSSQLIQDCEETLLLSAESKVVTDTYDCIGISCNDSLSYYPQGNISENVVGTESFHNSIFIGSGILGTLLLSITGLLLLARCYQHRKQRSWTQKKVFCQNNLSLYGNTKRSPMFIRLAQRKSLLEMDNILSDGKEEITDDEYSIVVENCNDSNHLM